MAKPSLARSLKSRQLKSLLLCVNFDGTAGGPTLTAAGPDAEFVSQIDKIAAGQYRIIFKESFEQNLWPLGFLLEGDRVAQLVAVGVDRITFTTVDPAGADADAICNISVVAHDHRFFY